VPSPDGIDADIPLLVRAVRLSYDLNRQQEWEAFLAEVRGIVRPLLEGDTHVQAGRFVEEEREGLAGPL